MSIRVALHHRTDYRYDRSVQIGPQSIRLRPAVHSRTPILSYALRVEPTPHFLNWQQDPQGNFLARVVFPERARHFAIEVDLLAELTVINPFDFFLEPAAERFPFAYDATLRRELAPFLELEPLGPQLQSLLATVDRRGAQSVDFLVALNRQVQQAIRYVIRLEPGVQSCEETLTRRAGSCRDTAWLLVQLLRQLGLAARFVSGYLIQLAPDVKALDGPPGPEHDFTDLHAWAEVYLPGAGWVGLDPTSGLLAGEGHIPLACAPEPASAAPVTGVVERCESDFSHTMTVTRLHEQPRVTKPYTDEQWQAIDAVGALVDQRLAAGDVRLTMGGEPTFVSIDDMDGAEWTVAADGTAKRRLAQALLGRLARRFAPGGLLHVGQGKWYPGEALPRWALTCYWRTDGEALWCDPALQADPDRDYGHDATTAQVFAEALAEHLGVGRQHVVPAFEDPWHLLGAEQQLPVAIDPLAIDINEPAERQRLARLLAQGAARPVGSVLPLERAWWQSRPRWVSGAWLTRQGRLFLLPGDSPLGLRLPLESLDAAPASDELARAPWDASWPRPALPPQPSYQGQGHGRGHAAATMGTTLRTQWRGRSVARGPAAPWAPPGVPPPATAPTAATCPRTALCVEPRQGRLHVFVPPLVRLEDYVDLVGAIEATARDAATPVLIEGYPPPPDHRLQQLKVTPDPGVIEVNIHPARSWDELVRHTVGLYEDARLSRLGTEKFALDGKHTGTGGGNHVVLGGPTPLDSPFLRRPDLLRSLVGYWNNHPALSYLFSGTFIGPTSQAPRVDEGRRDALYELQLAFAQFPEPGAATACPPWLVDRLLRHLLVDVTGNTHRAEFCIDKLYSPDSATGRLGLVELRAFEMPPHPRMSLVQQLLLRALVARFWDQPYRAPLVRWGVALHDRFMLPHFVAADLADVLRELRDAGFTLTEQYFAPQLEFRFPLIGSLTQGELFLELRQAIEPWYVLGEEPAAGGSARYVDSSLERLQVTVRGMTGDRHAVCCNGRRLPLHPTGTSGEWVAGLRYRAWQPPHCLHPTIPVHAPLVFDLLDCWNERSIGGCSYHVAHPGGRNHTTFPVNANEAEARRAARFFQLGHSAGRQRLPPLELDPVFPLTLDLRRPRLAS